MIQKQPIISRISVFTGEDITNTPDIVKKQITVEMKDILIRPDDVLEKMKKLKENKAPGIDKIHPKDAVTLFLYL